MMLALAAGCGNHDLVSKIATEAEKERALKYIDHLRAGNFDEITRVIDPSIAAPEVGNTLRQAASLIPAGSPVSITLVGAHRHSGPSGEDINLTYQYQFADKWMLINVATRNAPAGFTVIGIGVQPLDKPLDKLNEFTLKDKPALNIFFLGMTVLSLALTLVAVVLVIRNRRLSRRWPWILFVVAGFCQFSLNWTSGEWTFVPVAIQLFSASATAAPYGPWIVSWSFPLGAIIVIIARLLPGQVQEQLEGVRGSVDQ